jgi:2-polyprenyl-3-methyl-5-hydroxy-6-metoxy-1,4-benzoquinol methylase
LPDFDELNTAVRDIWDGNAAFWMSDGNDFHRLLIAPAQERLLALSPGDTVLDVACGNGQFARRMTELGVDVVAIDIAPQMIEHARARPAAGPGRIDYRVVDAADRAALAALGRGRFDAAVCTMAIMDMASIEPLLASLPELLRPGGRFVFSVMHPCFNSARARLVAEETTTDAGELVTRYGVTIVDYIEPRAVRGIAMRGQPAPQYYFDRPISVLFNACFKAGFVADGLEEPTFPTSAQDGRANWSNITAIPPALVARMRLVR